MKGAPQFGQYAMLLTITSSLFFLAMLVPGPVHLPGVVLKAFFQSPLHVE